VRSDDLAILAGIAEGRGGTVNDQRRMDRSATLRVAQKPNCRLCPASTDLFQSAPDADKVLLGRYFDELQSQLQAFSVVPQSSNCSREAMWLNSAAVMAMPKSF